MSHNSINQWLPPKHAGCLFLTVNNVAVSMPGEESADHTEAPLPSHPPSGVAVSNTPTWTAQMPGSLSLTAASCLILANQTGEIGWYFIICVTPVCRVCACFTTVLFSVRDLLLKEIKELPWSSHSLLEEGSLCIEEIAVGFTCRNPPLFCLISFIIDSQRILTRNCKNHVKRNKNFPQPGKFGWVTEDTEGMVKITESLSSSFLGSKRGSPQELQTPSRTYPKRLGPVLLCRH